MERVNTESWASDVIPSFVDPIPDDTLVLRDFGGIAMTAYGLVHNVTKEQVEEMLTPTYLPPMEHHAREVSFSTFPYPARRRSA